MIGKTISHYKIIEELGRGGMGIVYKAEDTKLKRTVALKFLPPAFTLDPEAKSRFIQEAQAASALQHNNICTIHDIDETDDGPATAGRHMFICMDYYEGGTLKNRIEVGPQKIDEAINIATQVAQGLARAHERGIVHRDIKPANIMITKDGIAKILDFGLAKLAGQARLSKTGTTTGTVAYMSPEQARGEEVDQRTDIWSFGVMLYEMTTGKLPFKGEYEQAVVYSIMNEDPEPMTGLRTGVPMELERITNKTLAKSPDERYQHVDEIEADLKILRKELETPGKIQPLKVGIEEPGEKRFLKEPEKKPVWHLPAYALAVLTVVVLGAIFYSTIFKESSIPVEDQVNPKSVAVLPFTTIGKSEEDEYFSEGIHDDILAQLAKIRDLKVIARTSVIKYRNTEKSISEIGKELKVASLLEGSVRRAGDRIRIVTQLINVDTEQHIWAETYDRHYADIFAIQSDVAQKIASALKATLSPEEKQQVEAIPTKNLEAYDYFLKGNYYWNTKTTKEGNLKAVEMYEKAIDLDPDFGLAYARVSKVHSILYAYISWDPTEERLNLAKTTLDKASALDPHNPETHFARGVYYSGCLNDDMRAIEEYEIAYLGQPNNSEIVRYLGSEYATAGKWDKAEEHLIKAYELDPREFSNAAYLGNYYRYLRNFTKAEYYLNLAINADPEHYWLYDLKARTYLYGYGDVEKARMTLEEGMRNVDPSELSGMRFLIEIYGRNYQEALEIAKLYPVQRNRSFLKGIAYSNLKNKSEAQIELDSASFVYQEIIKENPGDALHHSRLGIVYAMLGMKEDAIREGKKAVELYPELELRSGPARLNNLATIYIITGEHDKAIELLEQLLSIPSYVTKSRLKIDPDYDPLRDNPRFQRLLRGGE